MSTVTLLHSGLQDKRTSKALVPEWSELEVEIALRAIVSDAEEFRKFWNKHEIAILDDHSKITGFHNFFQKTRKFGTDPVFLMVKLNFFFLSMKL